ncbi:MAG TPA: DNA polymerase I [Candidatus Saccharimonadales bacterium]
MNYSKRLVIIDGKSVFYRGYYAMPSLATKDGTSTGGVYGFAVMVLEIVKKLQPDYVCVAWDKRKTNIRLRQELYPAYKANRKPAPPDFYEQIPLLYDLLESLGWPLYEIDDYEADDIMATFAKQAGGQGIESYLVTSDLDVLQLVNEHTHIYTIKKGISNIELFNVASFEEKYGVGAHQWVDVKALKGDASDNIPGVAGIGEKTALELIKHYHSLEGVYEHLDELKPAVRAKLEASKEIAFLSKKLVILYTDAPITLDLTKSKLDDGVTPEFVAMLRKLEFRNLLRQAEAKLSQAGLAEAEAPAVQLQPSKQVLFSATDLLPTTPRVLALNPEASELWVSAREGIFAPLAVGELTQELVNVLLNGPLVGHDLKLLFKLLLAHHFSITPEIGHDTKIGAFLLNSLERTRELSDLLEQTIDASDAGIVITAIWKAHEDQKLQFDQLPTIQKLANTIEFPTINLLAKMEDRGILLNNAYLQTMGQKFAAKIAEFEAKIHELAGESFNISSPIQLGHILFEKLNLPTYGIKKGKTGFSTGASELAKIRGLHPIVDLVTQYREYTKLKNTYIDALPKFLDEAGKLHTTYDLDVAPTGRLSSRDPNLQNIPTRTDIGNAIRAAFVPAAGNVFISADYSQFELRLAAVLADDKKMIEEFNQGLDIHTATAAEVYGVPLEAVTKEQRRNAKVVNFGVLYGMSPHGLSAATGMTRDEAKAFIDTYFSLRRAVREYMDNTVKQALSDGYVQTLFGRRRPTPDLKSSNFMVREAAKRAAMNMPIQGTEADLMKLAMLQVEARIENLGEQLLQVHDSILVEAPKANAEEVSHILKHAMENVYDLPIELKVDIKVGATWGDL